MGKTGCRRDSVAKTSPGPGVFLQVLKFPFTSNVTKPIVQSKAVGESLTTPGMSFVHSHLFGATHLPYQEKKTCSLEKMTHVTMVTGLSRSLYLHDGRLSAPVYLLSSRNPNTKKKTKLNCSWTCREQGNAKQKCLSTKGDICRIHNVYTTGCLLSYNVQI